MTLTTIHTEGWTRRFCLFGTGLALAALLAGCGGGGGNGNSGGGTTGTNSGTNSGTDPGGSVPAPPPLTVP